MTLERGRLDAATAKEDAEDAEQLQAQQAKQELERLFIQDSLVERERAKLDQALDWAAEEARKAVEPVINNRLESYVCNWALRVMDA